MTQMGAKQKHFVGNEFIKKSRRRGGSGGGFSKSVSSKLRNSKLDTLAIEQLLFLNGEKNHPKN